jgi:hypothetical protein
VGKVRPAARRNPRGGCQHADIGPVGPATGAAGGDLAGSYPNPSIASGAIAAGKLADGAVTGPKLNLPLSLSGSFASPFLTIAGNSTGSGYGAQDALLSATETGVTSVGPSIRGETQSQFSNFGTAGVMGVSSGTGGFGVFGYASHATGNGPGVIALSDGNGNGLTANSSNGNGVEATTDSGSDAGVYGWAPSFVTNGTGVRASSFGTNSVALRANAGGAGAKAAIFTGDVQVIGTLSKSAGTFKIDDPVDPAKKYLSHSFVESPDMKNIYDGIVVTDGNGFATVTMPDWFDALNDNFRYQLTVLGRSFARAIVWKELANRTLTIRTDEPGTKVSWQVTGIRHDAYANAHRTPVEQDKTGTDRGRCLSPELFGQPASKAIGAGG